MKTKAIDNWIQDFLQHEPLRAKSLVMTVFGDAITPHGGTVWLGSLIALLAPFGISDRLVRTSVFRLADEGWLEASRSGRRSQYRLSTQGEKRFLRAHQRVYTSRPSTWNGRWTLVMLMMDQLSAGAKLSLKKELLWEGFGQMASGLFAYPGQQQEALTEILARTGAANKVCVLQAADQEMDGTMPLANLREHGWPLHEVRNLYLQFIARFEPLQKLLAKAQSLTPQQALTVRTLLIHTYRRVQLQDPQLPAELLGTDWPGAAAHALCRDLYLQVSKQADQQVAVTLLVEQDEVPLNASKFDNRFK